MSNNVIIMEVVILWPRSQVRRLHGPGALQEGERRATYGRDQVRNYHKREGHTEFAYLDWRPTKLVVVRPHHSDHNK